MATGSLLLTGCDQFASVGTVGLDPTGQGNESGRGATRIDDCGSSNPAGLSPEVVRALLAGGDSAEPPRWLYPYEGAVFPAQLPAPLLMWQGPASDAVLLRLRASGIEYTGCLPVEDAGEVNIPEAVWSALQAALQGVGGVVELQLTTVGAGGVAGPALRAVELAAEPLPGAIFYMAYPVLGTPRIERLRLGGQAQPISAAADCAGCHAVAASGARLAGYWQGGGSTSCLSELSSQSALAGARLPGAELGALSPDGTLYVAPAHPPGMGTRTLTTPLAEAALLDAASGEVLTEHGIPAGAMTPAFSPDGALLAFNDAALAGGRGLAVMEVDSAARAARNYREVYRDADAYPAWPSFVGDARSIVFARGTTSDFSAGGAQVLLASPGPRSELYRVELEGSSVAPLARAMGEPSAADSAAALPFGSDDLYRNYHPQAAPVPAGGYAWIFFDSIRNYGGRGVQRRIWGAAIELGSGAADPSRPPFLVPGQSDGTNLRPVAALESEAPAAPDCAAVAP